MFRTIGLSAALSVLMSCGWTQSRETYLKRGHELMGQGKLADALLQFRKAIQKDPRCGEAWLQQGQILSRQGNEKEAYTALTTAVQLMPRSEEAKAALGRFALGGLLGNPKRQEGLYRIVEKLSDEILAANTESFEGIRLKAFLNLMDRRNDEAIQRFKQALALRPNDPEIATVLARTLFLDKQDREAEELAAKTLQNVKTYGPLYDVLYLRYMSSGRPVEAERLLHEKIASNPKEAFYMVQLADHYRERRDFQRVEEVLTQLQSDSSRYPKGRMEAGDYYRRMGKPEEASAVYQTGLNADPSNRKEYLERLVAVRIEQGGRNPEAIRILDAILKEHPDNTDAAFSKAALQMAGGEPAEVRTAIEQFRMLMEKHPEDTRIGNALARAHRQLGENQKAETALHQVLRRDPANTEALRELASIAIGDQKPAEALQYAERYLSIDPEHVGVRLIRTAAWALQGRLQDVRPELKQLTTENPNLPEPWFQMATLRMQEKNYAEAERILQRFSSQGTRDPRVLRKLVTLYLLQGRKELALEVARKQMRGADSQAAEVRTLVATAAAEAGDMQLALRTVQELASDYPGNAQHRIALGELYQRSGQLNQAIAAFQKAQQLAPADPAPLLLIGNAMAQTGRIEESIAAYRQALKLSPGDPALMNHLAWNLAKAGTSLDEALALAKSALQKAPGDPRFTDTLGIVLLNLKQAESASQTFAELVRHIPGNSEFRMHLAMALIAQGEKQNARTELMAALRSNPAGPESEQIRALIRSVQ